MEYVIPEYIKSLVTEPDSCNTEFFWFWFRQLWQKLCSVYDFKGIPATIDETYFTNMLFATGNLPIFNNDKYGLICQNGFPVDWDLYFRPTRIRVGTRYVHQDLEYGTEVELVKLTNDWMGAIDIVASYARRLAFAETSLQMSLINTRVAFAAFASSKAAAKAFEEMLKQVAQGKPAVIADSSLLVENMQSNNQQEPFQLIQNNIGGNYITDKLLKDISDIINEFDCEVGIPSANTNKKERLISSEVSFGNADTIAKVDLWTKCLTDSLAKVNALFGINITFEYNYEEFRKVTKEGGEDNGKRDDNTV